jgi:glycosyltransferase involved in cell wall biosynthesis
MIIAVEGYELGTEARGVGRAVHNIAIRLFSLLPDDTFVIFTKHRAGIYDRPRVSELAIPGRGGYLRWLNGPLWRALRAARPDIFIATNYVLPFFPPRKSLLFEHDISVISHPEWYPRKYALGRRLLMKRSLARALRVVAPSEYTRTEILRTFGVEAEKVRTIGYGIDDTFQRAEEGRVKEWKKRKRIEGNPVVGFLGSLFKRRHIPALIQAVARLREEIPGTLLYLVGRNCGALSSREAAEVAGVDWIRWEETVPEEELTLYYSSLDVFAYLSEYEGFGFPPLEALACGTPAVVMNRTSLGEIFNGLAVMVEHPEMEEVRAALRTALLDRGTRTRLGSEFTRRKSEFSWDRTALEVAALLEQMRAAG